MNDTTFFSMLAACVSAAILPLLPVPRSLVLWGERGHLIVGEVAADLIPDQMPAFFRNARAQLRYLNPEPDRWRSRDERAIDGALEEASAPEHFIDLEFLPSARVAGILSAPSRVSYADSLRRLGLTTTKVGLLPFRIVELTQELRVEFRLWRATKNERDRDFIEQRIINDAGILGHYVADGSNPAHTSVHFNGWSGANPNGYSTDNKFHARFETEYVQARIAADDARAVAVAPPSVVNELRSGVLAYLRKSNAEIEHLYSLDKAEPFGPRSMSRTNRDFTAERLAAGAMMLRDLWWTAWITSDDRK